MTRDEYLRRAGEINQAWEIRYSDRIDTAYPAGSDPHGSEPTDYPNHHAAMSAPAHYEDLLMEKLSALTREYQDTGGR